MKYILLVFLAAFVGAGIEANGQGTKPFILGITEEIRSTQLNEQRTLNIYLPEKYDGDTAHYPVLYLLDGSANEDFIHIVGLVQFLNMIEAMPKTIVVGIANVDRRRDFSLPTTIDSDRIAFPTTGHSDKFISFLKKDLQPFIEHKYRTNSSKTIIGQSFGGLLATEILIKKPRLFNSYLIVSPSLWWDNESLLTRFSEVEKWNPVPGTKIYVSVGTEGKQMEDDARHLVDMIKSKGGAATKVFDAPMPEENHLTILHNSAYKGLELLNKKGTI
jgi:predicted alpha/beta superfamily hydrolase